MKTLVLILSMLLSANAFSQKIDSLKVKEIENKIENFKPSVNDYLSKIEDSNDLDSIKGFANSLEVESDELILEIKKTFNIDNSYMSDYFIDMALSFVLTDLSSYYQVSAMSKLNTGINQKTPDYLASILIINKNARKIKSARKLEKVKKRNNQIRTGYEELIAINSIKD